MTSQPMNELEVLRNPKGELGRWLAAELWTRRLSVRETARQIGVSHSQVKNWIAGSQLDPPSIGKLADWAGLTRREVMRMAGYPLDPECAQAGDTTQPDDGLRIIRIDPEKVGVARRLLAKPVRVLQAALEMIEVVEAESGRPRREAEKQ